MYLKTLICSGVRAWVPDAMAPGLGIDAQAPSQVINFMDSIHSAKPVNKHFISLLRVVDLDLQT